MTVTITYEPDLHVPDEDGRMQPKGPRLCLKTPFSMKDRVKKLPGALWAPKPQGFWHVPATVECAGAVQRMLEQFETAARMHPHALELMARAEQSAAAQAHKTATDLPEIPGRYCTCPQGPKLTDENGYDTQGMCDRCNSSVGTWQHQKQGYHWAFPREGAGLIMDMGCLTGDTQVTINRGGNGRCITLEELHHKFNGGQTAFGTGGKAGVKRWDQTIPTKIRALLSDGRLGLAPILATLDKGKQPCLRLTLASGRQVTCTYDHEIVTPHRGKVHATDLHIGDEIQTNGSRDGHGYVWLYMPGHPNATPGGQVLEHHYVMSEHIGRPIDTRNGEMVHHLNERPDDNRLENLELLWGQAEHARRHDWRANLPGVFPINDVLLESISVGERHVYDVAVNEDAHTFIANGVVVGNTGKSKVAAALADGWEGRNVIIVAPPRAVKVWPKQFRLHGQQKWTVINHGGLDRRGRPRFKASMRQRIDAAEHAYAQARALNQPFALVVNYEAAWQEPLRTYLLSTLPKRFPSGKWDLGVADEGHKIKAPGGKWSKFMEQLAYKCERRLLLTGTMMPHDELDVYAQARFVDPGVFGTSYSKFKTRYFKWGGYEGHQLDRSDGHPYVDEAMRREFEGKLASMTFVVESDDVLDLPPQMHQPPIVFALGDRARRHYTELLNEWKTQLGDIDVDEILETPNVLSQMTRLAQVCSGYLPVPDPYDTKPKRLETIGTEKIGAFEDWLEDVPAGEKIVVFARFTQDLENIGRVAERLGRRYGEISGRRTDGLTDDATYPDDLNLIGVQIQAGGTGIDLSAARYACYYSLNFNLGDFDQSVKRLHRPGQRHPVAYYYLCAEGTIDQVILHALRQRASVIRGVLLAIKTGDVDPEGWDE